MKLICAATIKDASGINSVSRHLGDSELSDLECRDKLQQLISSSVDEVYIALVDNEIVGWLHVFHAKRLASANFYEIGGLVVSPKHRGRGIARSLVAFATKNTPDSSLRVRCNEKRRASHAFYQSIGFSYSKAQYIFEKNFTEPV